MMAAGSAGGPAVHVGLVPPQPGSPVANPWLVFALVWQWGPLALVIAWLAVTWQRIRTSRWAFPNTIAEPPAGHGDAATDPVKVLVNALRAARRVAGALILWLVARTTVFLASAVVTMFRVPPHRSAPRYGHRSSRSGSNRSRNPEPARGRGTRSAIWSKSLRHPGNRDFKINKPIEQ